jgi:hypothetical protein
MSEESVLIAIPQWLVDDTLAVLRAALDLPGVADRLDGRLDCGPGMVKDTAEQLEQILAEYPWLSTGGPVRLFVPQGGVVPDDVVLLLRQYRPTRITFLPLVTGGQPRTVPADEFQAGFREVSRDDFLAARRAGGGHG